MFAAKRIRVSVSPLYRQLSSKNTNRARNIYYAAAGLGATTLSGFICYDYVVNDLTYTGSAGRFMRSLKTAAYISYDYYSLQRQEDKDCYPDLLKEVHLRSANRLLETCLVNGGLYIKVGQGVAAINHILPTEYTETMSKLQDKCLPSKKADVQKVFKEDFGKLPEDIFAEFDYEPIAAASLAQVFRAKLKSGEKLAVKVQYADLQKRFPSDLGTLIFLQNIVEFFFKSYNFGWILMDLQKNLIQELDFIQEGRNAERCATDLQKYKFVYVPKVYWNHTGKRILTTEWIDGVKIDNKEALTSLKLSLKDIDYKLFTIFSEQIFNTGFVHADPHPGNIFVRKSKKGGSAELVILDHGLYEIVPQNVCHSLCEFWEATVLKNETQMQKSAKTMDINDHKNFAEVLFQIPFEINEGRVKTKLTDDDVRYMQEIAKHRFEQIMQTLKEMPRNILFIVRNLNTVRAISRCHGDIVDRPKVMARHAQKCLYNKYNKVTGYIRWIFRRIIFEFNLIKISYRHSLISMYINFLYSLGRSPAKYEQIVYTDTPLNLA